MTTTATSAEFDCAICGRHFTRKQGLGRHMSETHGTPTTRESRAQAPPRAPRTPGLMETIAQQAQALLEPLKAQLADVNGQLEAKRAEVTELVQARNYIERVIGKLEPPKPGSGKAHQNREGQQHGATAKAERDRQTKRVLLRSFMLEHADELKDGFTSVDLYNAMKAADVHPVMSPEYVRKLIPDLQDAGLLRADKVTRGGGMSYRLVMHGNNGNQGESNDTAQA